MQNDSSTLHTCRLYSSPTPHTKKPKIYRKKFGFGTPRIGLGSIFLWGGSSQIGGVTFHLQIYDIKTDTKPDTKPDSEVVTIDSNILILSSVDEKYKYLLS